jgi:hypothetical protein
MASGVVPRACSGLKFVALRCLPGCLLGSVLGCGGGAALLHPAQPLPVETVSVGAGVSGQFGSARVSAGIDRGRSAAGRSLTAAENANVYARGVLLDLLLSPGASPWVAARVGLPEDIEAGLTYTGRSLRLDGRSALQLGEQWTLSLGLGATGLLLTPERSAPRFDPNSEVPLNPQAEFEPSAKGWGADLPILLGYSLLEGFGDVWLGPRLGFERASGDLRLERSDPASPRVDLSGSRLWAGLIAGFSLGIPPVWLRFELCATYHRVSGRLEPAAADTGLDFGALEATGWTFAPSGAIIGKF